MSVSSLFSFLWSQTRFLLLLAVLVAGIIVVVARCKHHPTVSLLALLGFGPYLISIPATMGMQFRVMGARGDGVSPQEIARAYEPLAAALDVVRIAA